MATFTRLPSGRWRVQVRRKQSYASETFLRHDDGRQWAIATERRIDLGETPVKRAMIDPTTVEHLIDLHIQDMCEVNRAPRRSKAFTLEALRKKLGHVKLKELTRERLIQFGKDRTKEGAGPVTLSADLGYIKLVVLHAAAVHGIDVKAEPVDLARIALKRLGLIGKSHQRDRRPTTDELQRLLDHFDAHRQLLIPMGRIVRFAVASAMRQEEICRIRWTDVDMTNHVVVVRDRKDPREKNGNDQSVPLLDLTGFDAVQLVCDQRRRWPRGDLIFPYNSRSVGAAFRRACNELHIRDLHFHDLRHEATSRLFEAGLRIEQVALVTGHRDWKMLKRYTNLRPEDLHRTRLQTAVAATDITGQTNEGNTDVGAARLLASELWTQWLDHVHTPTAKDRDATDLQSRMVEILLELSSHEFLHPTLQPAPSTVID